MTRERFNARALGLAALGVALACESQERIAAPSRSRAGALSASIAASATVTQFGWEIFGTATATAADQLKLGITGSGTFIAPARGDGTSSSATGGGTWETRDANDAVTGSGSYTVTGLVRWERAVASVPSIPGSTAGLAVLRVAYDDGSLGTLTISCRITGAQPGRFEGVTATKGFVDYWSPTLPSPNLFYVLN